MKKGENRSRLTRRGPERIGRIARDVRRNWQLHLLILIPFLYLLIFHYGPIYGIQIAFRDYRPRLGITGSSFVGLKWFKKFMGTYSFWTIVSNTVILSLYTVAVGFPIPVLFALLLNTMRGNRFKKAWQTVAYMPHFISVVVVVSILSMIFSPINGIYGIVYRLLGFSGYPPAIIGQASSFRHMYVWSDVWQNLGWNTIIYTSALSAVPLDLHEAAMLDGASRWQRVLHVDLPTIMPTVAVMLILRFGSIMSVGFEKVYLMQSLLNKDVSEVISTYVYKVGMGSASDFSYGAAVGLFNSAINLSLLLLVNWITRRISRGDISLF